MLYWVLLTVLHSAYAGKKYECIHGSVARTDIPVGEVTYKEILKKRNVHSNAERFQPMRIHTYVDEVDPILTRDALQTIDHALERMEHYFANTLTVRQTFNPFILERTSCVRRWKTGRNSGKCSEAKVRHEFCSLKQTEYIIPEKFLDGLQVYSETGIYPDFILPKGEGVKDVNFFLFVISRSSSWCRRSGVQAYGSYCRLDSLHRPVAGLINLCPEYFSKRFYSPSYYYNVIMHEMIHVLGFSANLYPKFKHCERPLFCYPHKRVMVTDKQSVDRLVFPDVVEATQAHLNCSQEDMGAPLNQNDASHFHPLLMYTSLMVPTLNERDYNVIDNITLAVLASTGWYKVNFSNAQSLIIGKNEGCDFGYKQACEDSKHLCTYSKGAMGCDLQHFTIGKCEKISPTHPCGTYIPLPGTKCKEHAGKFHGVNIRNIYHEHRCFMLRQINATEAEPTCLLVKCRQHKGFEVYVNSSWVPCGLDTVVNVNNVSIECMHEQDVCVAPQLRPSLSTDSTFAVSLRIYFSAISTESNDFHGFKASTLLALSRALDIPLNYIRNATIFLFKAAHLDLSICLPEELPPAERGRLLGRVQDFLQSPSFSYIFQQHGSQTLPVASTKYTIEPTVAVEFSDYDGFRVLGVVFPAVVLVFIVGSILASILRQVQKRRPRRPQQEWNQMSSIGKTSSADG